MNNFSIDLPRKRRRNLLVVEGKHEKEELFWLLSRCFPEINIHMEDVIVYETNIYMLYKDLVDEYDENWISMDVDLPFIVSKKKLLPEKLYKDDFINIILVFDYERHDPGFSEEKIGKMQTYFADVTDVGKLYINYPMVESYMHLKSIPDSGYAEQKIPTSFRPGAEYKNLVKRDSVIMSKIKFANKIWELLLKHYKIDSSLAHHCFEKLLALKGDTSIHQKIEGLLEGIMDSETSQTAVYQFENLITNMGYAAKEITYWQYMRTIFRQIIIHNICKANKVYNGTYGIKEENLKEILEQLNFSEILIKQNELSRNEDSGYIWILNTCVLFVAEYNYNLTMRNSLE